MAALRAAALALAAVAGLQGAAQAQGARRDFQLIGANVQKRANAVLSLMGYSLTPDVTTDSLSLSDSAASNRGFRLTTLGGGFTWSRELPLYLESTAAYSRYDPVFIASNGLESRAVPVKWNTVTGTGGIGRDFALNDAWKLRPIFNFSLGRVQSDASLLGWVIENRIGLDIAFLENGRLNAYGLGGSLMLDYERYTPDYEIDLELRYTSIHLRSTGGTSAAVHGSATTRNAGLWSRWRAPTGLTLLDRPLRYVLEYSHSRYLADEAQVLGVEYLNAFGVGFELDSSKYPVWVTRTRLMLRYYFSPYTHGTAIGVAVSF